MNIDEIVRNAPEGATRYAVEKDGENVYFKEESGLGWYYSSFTDRWLDATTIGMKNLYGEAKPLPLPCREVFEYIPVTESVFLLGDFFNSGLLFYKDKDGYHKIETEFSLHQHAVSVIYKQVKILVTEREYMIEKCLEVGGLRVRDGAREVYGNLYDAGLLKDWFTERGL